MDPKTLISDDLLNSPVMEHHGTKGMKWGVWNEETRRKYLGGMRKAASAAASKVSKAAKAKVEDAKEQRKANATAREEVRQQRKELGMTRKKYDKLRETTLKSHDPRVVARGMKTLTDKELDAKLERLRKEEQVSRMATDMTKRKSEASKARSEAIKANPLYGIGMNVVGRTIKGAVNSATKDTVNSANGSGKAEKKESKNEKGKEGKPITVTPPAKNTRPDYVDHDRVRKVVRESAVLKDQINSDRAKSAASKGKRLLSDGTLKAEVIDVTPVSYSSDNQKSRKALPSAKD